MRTFTRTRLIAASAACALLAACGGGSQSAGLPQTATTPQSVTFTVSVPGSSVQAKNGKRIPLYTSRATAGMGIDVRSASSGSYSQTPNTSPVAAFAMNANASGCSSGGAHDGSYSCSFSVPAAAGYQTYRVTLWNHAPSGTSFAGYKPLSTATGSFTAYAGSAASVSLTLDPVVDSAAVTLNAGICNGEATCPGVANITATLQLRDAAGNTIVGSDALYDANGNALTIGLLLNNDKTDAAAACGTTSADETGSGSGCALYFSATPAYSTAASAATTTIVYDGTYAFPTSGSSVPSLSIVTNHALNGALIPATFSVTALSGPSMGAAPQRLNYATSAASIGGMAGASDGYIYFENSPPAMQYFNTGTAVATPASVATAFTPSALATSPGSLWYTDGSGNIVEQGLGTSDAGNVVTWAGANKQTGSLAYGPDGNMWFAVLDNGAGTLSFQSISMTDVLGTAYSFGTGYALGAASAAAHTFVAGTLGGKQAVCGIVTTSPFVTPSGSIACLDITDGLTGTPYTPATPYTAIAMGNDGNLYAASGTSIYKFTSYALAAPTLVATATNAINDITAGPEGNIWAAEAYAGGHAYVARLGVVSAATCSGNPCLTEWTDTAMGLTTANNPSLGSIITGPDNYIWVSDYSNNQTIEQLSR